MYKEGEKPNFGEKNWNKPQELLTYLLDIQKNNTKYSQEIQELIKNLQIELSKYPTILLTKSKASRPATFATKHFDIMSKKITELRQILLVQNLGDSELSQILTTVHNNIK
ncbi:MAG: hypothetical protein WC025_03945 [Candidatus Magasanikbacteria bacterium]